MILWTLFGLILVAGFFSQSPIGRLFRTALFGDPDRLDATFQGAKVLKLVLLVVALAAVAPVMPGEIALIFAGDLALYLEVSAALIVIGAVDHVRGFLRGIAAIGALAARGVRVSARMLQRHTARQRSKPRVRAKPPHSDDSEPGWAHAFA